MREKILTRKLKSGIIYSDQMAILFGKSDEKWSWHFISWILQKLLIIQKFEKNDLYITFKNNFRVQFFLKTFFTNKIFRIKIRCFVYLQRIYFIEENTLSKLHIEHFSPHNMIRVYIFLLIYLFIYLYIYLIIFSAHICLQWSC